MNIKKFDTDVSVFIGRFQPFHEGHKRVVEAALEKSQYLIIFVGSANLPRSYYNPFTSSERMGVINRFILEELPQNYEATNRVFVINLEDSDYNINDWLEKVHSKVDEICSFLTTSAPPLSKNPSISLIGHKKDASSYYLNLFPSWGSIDVPQDIVLSATDIRTRIFGDFSLVQTRLDKEGKSWPMKEYMDDYCLRAKQQAQLFLSKQMKDVTTKTNLIPSTTIDFLTSFIESEHYQTILKEYAFVARYKYAWKDAPYSPTFVTSDAVVIQSGHILLVKRRGFPGQGLWALPGGFVDQDETCFQACLRELKEETGIKIPPAVLEGAFVEQRVFDAPHRSSRGRTITHAFLFNLKAGPLPKIKKGGLKDDEETQKIAWVPLSRLKREEFFEDHFSIITNLTKVSK